MSQDPLQRHATAIVGIVIAIVLSMFVSAVIAGQADLDYEARAWTYAGAVLWVIVGGCVMFMLTREAESQALSFKRVLLWTASIWLWPVFALMQRGPQK